MPTLSAFADEISADLVEQLQVLKSCGLKHLDLRSVWNVNVMELTDSQCKQIKTALDGEGVKVAAIGSPIGKTTIDQPAQLELDRVKRAADLAEFFTCAYIRVFSFYPPEGGNIAEHGSEVLDRMAQWVDAVSGRPVILAHENEKAIFGDTAQRCVQIMEKLFGPQCIQIFDPANFVEVGETDLFDNAWKSLKKYTRFFHLKDCKAAEKTITVCGEGDGDVDPILADACKDGFDGFMTLEPHLSFAGQYQGFTGPELFTKAVDAVKKICMRNDVPLN